MRTPQKILVVRLGAMGDLLFTTPALRGLKKRYPQSMLTYVTMKQWTDLVKRNLNVDRVVGLSWRHPKALGGIARETYDLVINLQEGVEAAQISQSIPAKERRGNQWLNGRIVPDASGVLVSREPSDRLEQYRAGLSCAEIYCRIAEVPPDDLHFDYTPGWLASLRARWFLRRRGLLTQKRIVALHLYSRGSSGRSLNPRHALEIMRALPDIRFLVLSNAKEREQTKILETEPNATVAFFRYPVQAALLRHCALFAGIDSGPRNLASAMGTPVLWLCGSTAPNIMPRLPGEQPLVVAHACAPCFQETCPLGKDCLAEGIPAASVAEAIRSFFN